MEQDEIWDATAAAEYDSPGEGMFAPEVLGPTVDLLADLAGDGAALEFAAGTGRVTLALAERGVPVSGIELSGRCSSGCTRRRPPSPSSRAT